MPRPYIPSSTGVFSGVVTDYASLPTPVVDYAGQFWFVQTSTGGFLSGIGIYKYPKGIYSPNASNVWEQVPLNVKVSEDSTTLLNITNWAEFNVYAFDISAGDRLIFAGKEYQNLTGTLTATPPDTDTTNWSYPDATARTVEFDTDYTPSAPGESTIWWNGNEYTINITTGIGATIQVGQETLILFYNDTGVQIDNGSALHPIGGTAISGVFMPTVELADASDYAKCQGTLFVATSDVADGAIGFGTRFGKVRDVDTSTLGGGAQVWLSDVTPGGFVNTQPEFPSYVISMGGTLNADPTNGEIFVSITSQAEDTISNAWDGSIRETLKFVVTSDGATITGTLSNQDNPGDNLTAIFSDGFYEVDCTSPACDVTLTAGTATNPQTNYIYLDKPTKNLLVSTTEFPTTEHSKIAVVELFTAGITQTNGALKNQNWNDHIKDDDGNGHLLHITERMRVMGAQWSSGVAASLTGTTTNVYISTTAGKVWQLHKQTFPAKDMSTGDIIYVVNDPTTPYRYTSNLNDITVYSDGSTWNNEWSNIVIWGIANKTGEVSNIMVNLPSDGYNSESSAVADASNYTDYGIPSKFKSVGFLIARFTIRRSGTTFTYNSGTGYQDLRGFVPNTVAGGGAGGGGVSEFLQLTDTPSSYSGQAGNVPTVNAGETALEFTSPVAVTGSVTMYAGTSAPTGYLICDGSAISRTTYSALFTAIGTNWGVGDGTTTFNIPDMRAAAPYGVGTSTGYTQNETIALADKDDDQIQGHRHDSYAQVQPNRNYTSTGFNPLDYRGSTGGSGGSALVRTPISDGTNGTPRTGTTTHGKRIGINFIIKT